MCIDCATRFLSPVDIALTLCRCDLSRPCQTCRDRDHPELCSYHPPNKRQSIDQGASFSKPDELPSNGGLVTLSRNEFDFLCRKLNTLESSIADLRREMGRNTHHQSPYHDPDIVAGSNIDPQVEGRSQEPTHADVHGVHMKNVAVSSRQLSCFHIS